MDKSNSITEELIAAGAAPPWRLRAAEAPAQHWQRRTLNSFLSRSAARLTRHRAFDFGFPFLNFGSAPWFGGSALGNVF